MSADVRLAGLSFLDPKVGACPAYSSITCDFVALGLTRSENYSVILSSFLVSMSPSKFDLKSACPQSRLQPLLLSLATCSPD